MKDKEKKFKTVSGVLHIIAMIIRVFLVASAVVCILAAITFAIGRSHIDLNAAYAELQQELAANGVMPIQDAAIDGFLSLSSVAQTGIIMSALLAATAFVLAISAIFHFLAKLFKNFETKKTPFLPENVELLRKVAHWMLGVLIASCVVSIGISIATNFETDMVFGLGGIEMLLIAYGAVYIFEYGCGLEEKNKKKEEKEKN